MYLDEYGNPECGCPVVDTLPVFERGEVIEKSFPGVKVYRIVHRQSCIHLDRGEVDREDHANDYNTHRLNESIAIAKLLLDANVLSYAQEAFIATGVHLLNYLDALEGKVDWFVASCVARDLHNNSMYDIKVLAPKILNCDSIDMKMEDFPFIKEDDSLGFVKLNRIAGDDWAQISLAHNHQDLIVVTNDSAMFKSAHASLEGRAIAFHDLLEKISPHWVGDKEWLQLKKWLNKNKKPLRNNSSWKIPGQKINKSINEK